MKFTTLSRRTAASALVAGALVGANTTVAQAAPTTTTYTCTNPSGGDPWTVPVVSNIPELAGFPQVPAGLDVGAGLLNVTNDFTIQDDAHDTLVAFGVEDLTFPDYAGALGSVPVDVAGMTAKVSEMTDNGNGTWSFNSNGSNAAFEVPRAGTYDVTAPADFQLVADVPGVGAVPSSCVLAAGTEVGIYQSVEVLKNDSTSAAKAVNAPVKKGTVAKVKVKVKVSGPDFQTPSGKVVLKKGKKTVAKGNLNAKGVVVLKTKSLPVGKNKLKTVYKGDGYTNKSKDGVVVKVVR